LRIIKRKEVPVSSRYLSSKKNTEKKIARSVTGLFHFLSNDVEGNRFQVAFSDHHPFYKKAFKEYRNFKNFLGRMTKVAISKIWSKTETEEVVMKSDMFMKGVSNALSVERYLNLAYSAKENKAESLIVEKYNDLKMIMESIGDFKEEECREKLREKMILEERLKRIKLTKEKKERERNRIREENKREKDLLREYYNCSCDDF
jgi:hypothetical protein